ncbi:MAG TPA: hypothetical protein VGN69_05695 [Solirubrobacteraceae bacterium]|jgi:hypothetical protein|nr:hypothetical protein [Solirubrobacteraceae bacterium]
MPSIALIGVLAAAAAALLGFSRRLLNRSRTVAEAVIRDPAESTVVDDNGAVRSVQAAELTLPAEALQAIWTPMHLERLARTYWRFLSRCTLGLIRVDYSERERFVVFLRRPFVLLSFHAPEYEMNADRGIVRWRIESGVLVSRAGRDRDGYLQIDVQRRPDPASGQARVHVEVEVANFYPAIAAGIGRWVYKETQSRLHVIVTHGFLRSLARLDLAPSRVGRYAEPEDASEVPDPPPTGRPAREGAQAAPRRRAA